MEKPLYCGIRKNKFLDDYVIRDNWNRPISKESFKLINDRFEAKTRNEHKSYTAQIDKPHQNKLYCGCCSSKMTGHKKGYTELLEVA